MTVINVDSTLDFVVELPCKKVLLFNRIDKDRVYAEVFRSREQFDLASRGWKLAPNATRIKRRTFWLKEELNNLRAHNKSQQDYVFNLWLVGDISSHIYAEFLMLKSIKEGIRHGNPDV